MAIPIEHLSDADFLDRSKQINTDHLLTESDRKLQAAKDRKDKADPEVIEIPKDFEAIEAQIALVRSLQRGAEGAVTDAKSQTSDQEKAIDQIIHSNARLMKRVDLAVRMKLLSGDGYERGVQLSRSVPAWEKIAEKRLTEAKKDKDTLKKVGLKEQHLTDYEEALKQLKQKDRVQESGKPIPVKTRKSLNVEQGKLHYMMVWLCGIFEDALEGSPEEARLFRVADLARPLRPGTKGDGKEEGDDEPDLFAGALEEDGSPDEDQKAPQ